MKKKSLYRILSLAALACMALGAVSVQAEDKTLRVGVRGDIMNFSYQSETNGKYYGMEIDLAQKLAKELGYSDLEYVQVTPEDRKDMLLNGEVDCLIAAYSISDSRLENFDFSPAYYVDDTVIMVQKSSLFKSVRDLKDKTVGILGGTNAGPLLAIKLYETGMIGEEVLLNNDDETRYDNLTVLKLDSYKEVSEALEEGKIDAACMDGVIANAYMNEDRDFLELDIAEQEYGVATLKDSELSAPMAEAVQKFLDDGTIEELIDKWD
ncbi:MAG: transporter substrate-binding domain-containing protein [Eubacteriales bacterium]|nr:transporter substrate-binding domain-containing protein [Eubacteriales bacterium]